MLIFQKYLLWSYLLIFEYLEQNQRVIDQNKEKRLSINGSLFWTSCNSRYIELVTCCKVNSSVQKEKISFKNSTKKSFRTGLWVWSHFSPPPGTELSYTFLEIFPGKNFRFIRSLLQSFHFIVRFKAHFNAPYLFHGTLRQIIFMVLPKFKISIGYAKYPYQSWNAWNKNEKRTPLFAVTTLQYMFLKGNSFGFPYITTRLHLPPLRFHCVGGSWIWTLSIQTTAKRA